jgi:methyl-accepting chemotaxis protein
MDNRRTRIVINKKFQYQYSLLIAAMSVLLVNGFIIVRMLFPGDQALALTTPMAMGLAAVELILLAGIWYASLVASHRIAGPVYVFAREITRLGEGDLTASIRLLNKDMFQPEAALMNASFTALSDKVTTAKALCAQLQQEQANGGDTTRIVQQISEHISTFTTTGE